MDPNVLRLAMGAAGADGPEYQLWSWGYNGDGQLGSGTTTDRSSPVQVGALKDWSSVSGGQNCCLAIKTNGTLWAWGKNANGQLGLGNTTYYSSPVQVGSLTNWLSVSAGYRHILAVKTDGTLWAWGSNGQGSVGDGTTTSRSSPVQIGSLTTWSKVSAGVSGSSLAIKTDGTLWAWGYNQTGELGLSNTTNYSSPVQVGALTNWSKIFAHGPHTHAIKTDGTLWAWGQNGNGELGVGNQSNYSSPVQVGALTNWRSVSKDVSGGAGVIAVKTNNTAWAWGSNPYGGLGLGDTTTYSSPVQIGALTNWSVVECDGYSSIGLKTDGTIWTWGYNFYGQLGQSPSNLYSLDTSSPVQVGALTTWQSVAAGRLAQYAIKKP